MTDIKDVMEAEKKRRAALTDEEREAEDGDREARRARVIDSFSDTARLAEQARLYSRELADISAASPIGQIEDLLKSYSVEHAFQGVAERAARAIGSLDLPDYTDQLVGIRESAAQALAATSGDYIDGFRDLARTESKLISERLRSLSEMPSGYRELVESIGKRTSEADTLRMALPDFRETLQGQPDVPILDPAIETPFPDMLEALEEIRAHQKESVDVMAAMHKSQTAHNIKMIGVLGELNRQMRGTSVRDILLLSIATLTLFVAVVGSVIASVG